MITMTSRANKQVGYFIRSPQTRKTQTEGKRSENRAPDLQTQADECCSGSSGSASKLQKNGSLPPLFFLEVCEKRRRGHDPRNLAKFHEITRTNLMLISDGFVDRILGLLFSNLPGHRVAPCVRSHSRKARTPFSKSDRKSTRLNSSHIQKSRMPSSA